MVLKRVVFGELLQSARSPQTTAARLSRETSHMYLLRRACGFADECSVIFAHDEDREAIDVVEVVRAE